MILGRKAGWKFYQRVIVRFAGSGTSNYFNNFAVGYVVHADKDNLRIVSESGKMTVTAMNIKDSETVYTMERFRALAKEMIRLKHFSDPSSGGYWVSPRPVELDAALRSERSLTPKLKSSKTRTEDLVSIISKMSNGFSTGSTKKRKTSSSNSGEISMDWRA